MKMWNIIIAMLLSVCIGFVHSGTRRKYIIDGHYNFVYTTQHFDTLACGSDDSNIMLRDTFIELYAPECENEATGGWHYDWQQTMPPPQNVLFVRYEYVETPELVWFKEHDHLTDKTEYLYERYPPVDCSTIYFISKGAKKVGQAIRYVEEEHGEFVNWAWECVKLNITLRNQSPSTKYVKFMTQRNLPEPIYAINNKKNIVLTAYPSDYMIVFSDYDGAEFFGGRVLYHSQSYILDERFPEEPDESVEIWLDRNEHVENNNADLYIKLLWSHGERELVNIKQPLIVPNFTITGYEKYKTPSEVQQMLINHYNNFQKDRVLEENMPTFDSVINTNDKYTGFVSLDWDINIKPVIMDIMLPYVETWCNCKLEPTYFYGIREYYTDHVLRMHVDRIETHVISVIFQIYRDLNGQQDWPVGVVNYDGTREDVYIEAGEMLFYESAKLIHGRPTKFKGKVYANAFLHYVPIDPAWHYRRVGHTLENMEQNIEEHINSLKSPITEGRDMFKTTRDEL